MFDHLSDRLKQTFRKFSGQGVLSETQVEESVKEIRRSLLEADVHFKIAKDVCEKIKQKAIGQKVWETLSPHQQLVQIFHEELIEILGGKNQNFPDFSGPEPVVVLVAGLQGSGKTTFCAKLALHLKKKLRKSVGLIPADCARPAAKKQLQILGEQVQCPVFDSPLDQGAVSVAKQGVQWARSQFFQVCIVDTAGRQQVDNALMQEVADVSQLIEPAHTFLVLDSMLGSQGLDVAKTFHEKISLTGLCLTKLDGDSRGGVALSARGVTGIPIYFAGTGEKTEDLEPFYPDRMASRILGMGDVLTLIEKARENINEDEARDSAQKMMRGEFTLVDFKEQLKKMQSMGPLENLLKLMPGMGDALSQVKNVNFEKELKRIEAMIDSMTPEERSNHGILNGRRKQRISLGSGVSVAEINRFLKQFMEMAKMMKQFSKFGGKNLLKMFGKKFGSNLG